QVLHITEFVARLPRRSVQRALAVQPVLRLAQMVDPQQNQPLRAQRKSCQPISERSIAIQIAASREVALQRRGPLPHLAAAMRVAVVIGIQRLVRDRVKALSEKQQKKNGRDTLRTAEHKSSNSHICSVQSAFGLV